MCSVYGCYENRYNDTSVHLHRFPQDEKLRKKWIYKCYRADKFNWKVGHVCSRHFTEENYQRNLKKLLSSTSRDNLNQDTGSAQYQ